MISEDIIVCQGEDGERHVNVNQITGFIPYTDGCTIEITGRRKIPVLNRLCEDIKTVEKSLGKKRNPRIIEKDYIPSIRSLLN